MFLTTLAACLIRGSFTDCLPTARRRHLHSSLPRQGDVAFLPVSAELTWQHGVMIPDRQVCLSAMTSKDSRFDGRFFTGVRTTGIYCRPSCPAMTPHADHVEFYPSAAAAQSAGFRACRRCRPDATPRSPEWDTRGDIVARAVRLIADGEIDRAGVAGLAARLGYSVRQLQRSVTAELGVGPLALARTQRIHTARLLIETTDLPLTDIAFSAGFGSVRSFNASVKRALGRTPREVRAHRRSAPPTDDSGFVPMHLRLAYRPPFEPGNVFGHLAATAVPGVEEWRDGAYRRTLSLPHGPGIVALRPSDGHVAATLWLTDPRDLTPAIGRCRRLLDLDSDPVAVDDALSADPTLAPLVARAPGRRVPRVVDGPEFAFRAVIGQQVSTRAAQTQTGQLVQRFGTTITDPAGGLTHLFPTPEQLSDLRPEDLPGYRARSETLVRMVEAVGSIDLGPGAEWAQSRAALAAIPGVGPWTVEMIAMRALGDPDAFPANDLGLRRAAATLGLSTLERSSAAWRPWRSYATQYLWAVDKHPINSLPED